MFKYIAIAPHLSHGHCPRCGASLQFKEESTRTVYGDNGPLGITNNGHLDLFDETLLKYVQCIRCCYKEYYEPVGLAKQINQMFHYGIDNMPS